MIKAKGQPGEEWQNLPRGDDSNKRKLLSRAVAKVKASVINELIEACIEDIAKGLENKTIEHLDQKRRRRTEADVLRLDEKDRMLMMQEEESAAQDIIREEEEMARAMMRGVISVAPKKKEEVLYASLAFAGRMKSKRNKGLTGGPGNMNTVTRLRSFTKPLSLDALKAIASSARGAGAGGADFAEQFHNIPLNNPKGVLYPEETVAMNRVSGVLPQPHTRVKVERSTGSGMREREKGRRGGEGKARQGGDVSYPHFFFSSFLFFPGVADYINANYVRGPDGQPHRFIATQSPLSGQERGKVSTVESFWSMVWTHYTQAIVMLCGLEPYESCIYWPSQALSQQTVGKYTLMWGGEKDLGGVVMTKLVIYRAGTEQGRTVTHFRLVGYAGRK